ncbi:BatA domain-containing protein [Maribacter litopenaei]|uniref:BatA domain-containing protein n=1 Tax=Maribacter litopenaei TaxID=2976127 RepID=UPI003B84995B
MLLAIPIIIHLFQLRRFKKTPFTNVKLLKRVVSESEKEQCFKKMAYPFGKIGHFCGLDLCIRPAI